MQGGHSAVIHTISFYEVNNIITTSQTALNKTSTSFDTTTMMMTPNDSLVTTTPAIQAPGACGVIDSLLA